jgi:phosphocarrier protein HPr
MLAKKMTLINKLGLHARAAMKLSELATRFQSTILIRHKNHEINAKSILNVMALAASYGTELELLIEGEDEAYAMKRLSQLIQDRFGEDE